MKKTLAIFTAVLFLSSIGSAFATDKIYPSNNAESTSAISAYLEATAFGNIAQHSQLFSADFEYINSAHKGTYNKKQFTKFLRENTGLVWNCTTNYEVLDQTNQVCVAKASMVFETFTRVDYITLRNGEDGWQISKVLTTYP